MTAYSTCARTGCYNKVPYELYDAVRHRYCRKCEEELGERLKDASDVVIKVVKKKC